jgi:hypothetical protein
VDGPCLVYAQRHFRELSPRIFAFPSFSLIRLSALTVVLQTGRKPGSDGRSPLNSTGEGREMLSSVAFFAGARKFRAILAPSIVQGCAVQTTTGMLSFCLLWSLGHLHKGAASKGETRPVRRGVVD